MSVEKKEQKIPFADPMWLEGYISPYYKQTHFDFQKKCREFVDKNVTPFIEEWEQKETYPSDLASRFYEAGIYGAMWPVEYGGTPPKDVDIFHEIILYQELIRSGAAGWVASCFLATSIGLPPVIAAGSEYLRNLICRDVVIGKKGIALAVTEPKYGSDVSGIETVGVRQGENYIVNGQKKFITAALTASWLTTAVRTETGISLLMIPTDLPGIKIRRMQTQGWLTSHTCHILFEDVKVPAKNILGQEGQGFKYIMVNFNHERLVGIAMTNRSSRNCLEDAVKYAQVRKTFGKPLIAHQVIRHKLAQMAIKINACDQLLDFLTFQIVNGRGQSSSQIAGTIALLKPFATQTLEFCAREASQVFGGNAFVRGGVGSRVERTYREVRVAAIGAGSEEIMWDLGLKQSKL